MTFLADAALIAGIALIAVLAVAYLALLWQRR